MPYFCPKEGENLKENNELTRDDIAIDHDMQSAEKLREDHNQTPQEFCEEHYGEEPTIGGIL